MAVSEFSLTKFVKESIQIFKSPKTYFSSIKKDGELKEAVIKSLMYGLITYCIQIVDLRISPPTELPPTTTFIIWVFVIFLVMSLIMLYVGSFITLVISAICGGNTNFSLNARVVSSIMVVWPAGAALGTILRIFSKSYLIYPVVTLVASLYGLALLRVALIESLEAKHKARITIILVFLSIFLIFSFIRSL